MIYSEFAESHLTHINKILDAINAHVLEYGDTAFEYNFIDWQLHYEKGEPAFKQQDELAGVHYLLLIALNSVKELFADLGKDTCAVDNILRKLGRKKFTVNRYKQAAALAVLSGENSEHNLQILRRGGAKDVTVFMAYPILSALCRNGEYELAFSIMKEYYGGMLRLGATTFWEDFDIEAAADSVALYEMPVEGKKNFHRDFGVHCYKGLRHSLCHGWSSGVIAYITQYILGLQEVGIGGTEFKLCPHLGELNSAEGKIPTRYGAVSVTHTKRADGSIDTQICAPPQIKIIR